MQNDFIFGTKLRVAGHRELPKIYLEVPNGSLFGCAIFSWWRSVCYNYAENTCSSVCVFEKN